MKATSTIFIVTFILYIEGSFTFKLGHANSSNQITDIPAQSENNRMMEGKAIGKEEYAYVAYLYYPHYLNADDLGTLIEIRCRGVLLVPKWVVTVAHCFDTVIKTMKDRGTSITLAWQFEQLKKDGKIGQQATVRVGGNVGDAPHFETFIEKMYIPDRYNILEDRINAMDVALVRLQVSVPKNIASPPSRIDNRFLADASRMNPSSHDCWTVSAGQSSPVFGGYDKLTHGVSHKMKVIVGNRQYCTALGKMLFPKMNRLEYPEELVCAKSNDSVNPGARACLGDDGAALVCGGRLLGLLVWTYDRGTCEEENAYAVYVYLGHRDVFSWIYRVVNGSQETKMYRSAGSDENASGFVEASKIMTCLLTVISVTLII